MARILTVPIQRLVLVLFALLCAPALLFCQSTLLGDNCDLSAVGAKDSKGFLAFDQELRVALSKQDAGMMALLVENPLRVSDAHGNYSVDDPRSVQLRFRKIFTPAIQRVVLQQHPEAVWCNYTGIMYGDGNVWVHFSDMGYKVATVNVPAATQPKSSERVVEFVCDTDKYRVIVDAGAKEPHSGEIGDLRYRSWNKPRALFEKPDLEIPKGTMNYEGSGPCVSTSWSFAGGQARFTLTKNGECGEDSTDRAYGSLQVSTPGKSDLSWSCH